MQVTNLQVLRNIPFEQYLQLPGYSHSGIRNAGVIAKAVTPKMLLGKAVDQYLTEPAAYDGHMAELVVPLAGAVKRFLGGIWSHLESQLAFTANFVHEGFTLPYKGRADLGIIGKLIIDLKVSTQPLPVGIAMFGYDNQLAGYALATGARVAILISINPKNKQITTYNVPVKAGWWEYHVKQKGEVL